jgi:hypothetical protein
LERAKEAAAVEYEAKLVLDQASNNNWVQQQQQQQQEIAINFTILQQL